jgi:phage terminase small subunit
MGLRGPKPQPTALKLIKGNPGKRPLKKDEPTLPPPPADASAPPKRLKGAAAEEWARLFPGLVDKGIVHVGNLTMFEEYCYVLGEMRRCENLSKKISADMAIMRGYFKAAATFRQQLRQLARDIGLTVLAGENIADKKKPESKLDKFIRPA